ncbi:universal stress protein [Amycolatopsis mediterranei S699]|uniref:Universal stress protein n=2 Tax=Amycolatopsis mediterranei TaxID=33910 RepID=A0A0H3D896_AMYMU|nr:universal stress protein [Amycolatopsis mediterranei]ADJ47225.1 universal stress protein [Amycolatopsis mediterranei U32]AEK44049.1 universal stress protein [Amycolatopsis mediterranei S699]AFO78936.1 universal stress protein [Amycolatopsis mediterranei S699]AGT86064.1 universal stress protein [Amycolatopsis mediterranei RB]KDO04813.1 universal stress protein [Amycolatopsis mediterranei]
MTSPKPHTGRAIVVGTDGTPRGDAALRWALEVGAHAGDVVRAILVRPRDSLLPGTSFAIQPHGRVPEADYSLDDHIAGLSVDTTASVETRTVHGDPATELVTASADADLLVLGTHRGGALTDLVLGSVGRECVRFSRCPVVVITPEAAHRLLPA